VVPAGAGWTRPPFELTTDDQGNLYGRGVADNKGSALSALLALRAVKDMGIPLKRNCRLILGTDEELGFSDMHAYYAAHPYATHTFTPDSQFPVVNTEKGHYHPLLTADWQSGTALPRITRITGSDKRNVIPARSCAEVLGLDRDTLAAACRRTAARCNVTFTIDPLPAKGPKKTAIPAFSVTCNGAGGHAAYPANGGANNSLTALLALLSSLPLAQEEPANQAVQALSKLFPHGDWLGEALGIAQCDPIAGDLTLTFSVCDLTETGLRAQWDSRMPLSATEANCRSICAQACAAHGFTLTGDMGPVHHVPADSDFVKLLLRDLEEISGITGAPVTIGGGTYVHSIPGGVAFGGAFPDTETYAHGADETIPLHQLLTGAKVFTKVILDLCTA